MQSSLVMVVRGGFKIFTNIRCRIGPQELEREQTVEILKPTIWLWSRISQIFESTVREKIVPIIHKWHQYLIPTKVQNARKNME